MMASSYSNSSLIFISICCALLFLLNGQMTMAQSAGGSNDGASSASSNSSQPIILPPTRGFCPPGEVLLNCSMPPGCEPTCEQPEPSQYCVQICPVARCHCVLGHVRSPSGNCIPYEQCPCRNRPEPQCDAGYNHRGECKCRCGINERCHLVRNSTGDCGCPEKCGGESQERVDDEQWECVSILRCGEYDCIPGVERCQISNATLRPECVPINAAPGSMTSSTATSATSTTTSTTSERVPISSTPIGTTSEAATPSTSSSSTPKSPLMTSATTKAPEANICGSDTCGRNGLEPMFHAHCPVHMANDAAWKMER